MSRTKTNPNYVYRLGATKILTGIYTTPPAGMSFIDVGGSVTFGDNVAGWKQAMARGDGVVTSLSGSRSTWDRGRNYIRFSARAKYRTNAPIDGTLFAMCGIANPPTGDGGTVPLANNSASQQFYKKLSESITLFQGGVFLGELAETVKLIKSPAKALRGRVDDLIGSLKKRGPKPSTKPSRRQWRKDIADTYLEHAFGWSPLLSDIDDAGAYFNRRHDQLTRSFKRVTGGGSADASSHAMFVNTGGSLCRYNYEVVKTWNTKVKYVAVIMNEATNVPTVSESLGVNLKNFIPTAWELVPWSFLIDYFTNVGDVVTALSLRTVKFHYGWKGVKTTATARNAGIYLTPIWVYGYTDGWREVPGYTAYELSGLGKTETISVNRSPISSVPVPSLSFEVPGVGNKKWLNVAALTAARKSFKP